MKTAGIEPNKYIYNSVIAACEDSSQWSKALEVFDDMKNSNIQLDYIATAGRNLMYKLPEQVLAALPSHLVVAAKAAVQSGRAARKWIAPS